MNRSAARTLTALLLAVAATWFVARPAFGVDPVEWRSPMKDGPWDLAADARGVVVTTSQHSVYALDVAGNLKWRVPVDDLVIGQPAVGPDIVLVGGEHGVSALARADGTLRWHRPTTDQVHSLAIAAAVGGDTAFVGDTALLGDDTGTLAAVDTATGNARWSVQFPGALWSGARVDAASGAVVAAWHQSATPAVRVLDLATGALRWSAPIERDSAAPVVGAGAVVLAVGDGNRHARVEARDLATGALRWDTAVPASFEEGIEPAVVGRTVAVVDHFGVVSVLDLTSGLLRWQRDLADAVLATRVSLTTRRVAFTSYAGVLYVLDRRDGHLVARIAPERLGGLPVATLRAPWRGPARLLVALRMHDWGVQLRRLP